MKKVLAVILVLCCLLILDIPILAYDNVNIVFSDIGTKGFVPGLLNTTTKTGLMNGNYPMVKASDIASVMGALLTLMSDGRIIFIRGSQTTTLQVNSTTMTTSNTYSYYDPVNNSTDTKTFAFSSVCQIPSKKINSITYVPLTETANQLGALIVTPWTHYYRVYDFRINGTTPKSDTNDYIVGGDWISNWSNSGNTNLSDHFDIYEIWSSPYFDYPRQMKFAVSVLESAERVRYYYNNNSSMKFTSAFRSYSYNNDLDGSGPRSYHMRGHAWDCATDALYYSVKNEFKGSGTNGPPDGSYWRTNVPTTDNSRGYEIEKMPVKDEIWLHLQRQPGVDTPDAP